MSQESEDNPTQPPLIVVKLGGTEGVDFSAVCRDTAALLFPVVNSETNPRLVLVHGGSAEANSLGEALGTPPRFITSPSGYTSRSRACTRSRKR